MLDFLTLAFMTPISFKFCMYFSLFCILDDFFQFTNFLFSCSQSAIKILSKFLISLLVRCFQLVNVQAAFFPCVLSCFWLFIFTGISFMDVRPGMKVGPSRKKILCFCQEPGEISSAKITLNSFFSIWFYRKHKNLWVWDTNVYEGWLVTPNSHQQIFSSPHLVPWFKSFLCSTLTTEAGVENR